MTGPLTTSLDSTTNSRLRLLAGIPEVDANDGDFLNIGRLDTIVRPLL